MGLTHMGLWGLEKVGIVPAGTQDVVQRMKVSGDALVRGGQAKVIVLFTTMFCAIAPKKADAFALSDHNRSSRRCICSSSESLSERSAV